MTCGDVTYGMCVYPCSVVLVAAVSALSTVVSVLAKFISPHLQQITLKV